MSQILLLSLLDGIKNIKMVAPEGVQLADVEVSSITVDSREVTASTLFVALVGVEYDGHSFVGDAMSRGCSVVVINRHGIVPERREELLKNGLLLIETDDTAKTYAELAANYYQNPAEKLTFVGITGTNGKTTITYLVEHVLRAAGVSVGVIGTVNNRYTTKTGGQTILPTRFTTPEALSLQKVLREMVDQGVKNVIIEVSSHALAQERIGTVSFEVAAFTNLSRDHLDYHKDMDSYFQAKALMFSHYLQKNGTAVLPEIVEGSEYRKKIEFLHENCESSGKKIVSWGMGDDAAIQLQKMGQTLDRTEIEYTVHSRHHSLTTPLVGHYNVENLLSAFGICLAMGIDESTITYALSTAKGAPGRVQRISTGDIWPSGGPAVLVDYAHTPDALEKVLSTVKELPHTNLYCVFGCGGDRDGGKRPEMGGVAARISDVAIVADDNPRTEDPEGIIEQILPGVVGEGVSVKDKQWLTTREKNDCGCVVIRNRKDAISAAISCARTGDIVVIAGKGHEPYQLTIQGRKYFDDRKQAENVLFSWTDELIAKATDGVLLASTESSGLLGKVSTDSRKNNSNGVFVALKGDSHDGHAYAKQAVENGNSCLLVEKEIGGLGSEVSQVRVADTTKALGDLAAYRRMAVQKLTNPLVVGLTGSCGKTTVKEMVAAVLQRKWPEGADFPEEAVLKTKGNFNNLIGLPLSLLPIGVDHRAAVMEMGMNIKGEIARLAEIADPDISCITNIHGAHLEGLGSIEGVAQAKEELFTATKNSATLVVNLDDVRVRRIARKYNHKKITYAVVGSLELAPDLWATDINMEGAGVTTFTLHYREERAEVHLFIPGEHNVSNALCAASIGIAAGVQLQDIVAGLADFRPADKRMEVIRSIAGFNIINDTYNANPASMAAGLRTLKQIASGKMFAVLGDMLELGSDSAASHYDVGKLAAELKIDDLALFGEFKDDFARGARENGLRETQIHIFDDKDAIVDWLKTKTSDKELGKDDLLLVKASRGLRFETIVAQLVE